MRALVVAVVLAGCAPKLRAADVAAVKAVVQVSTGSQGLRAAQLATVGEARVVGFGAPVAGAGAQDGLAVGLLMELVVQRGFSGLALDVDATAARALDAYVGGAEVSIEAALAGLGPVHAIADLRALLAWMRAYNLQIADAPGPGGHGSFVLLVQPAPGMPLRRVRVFGLDPRDGDAAAAVVIAYLERVDPEYVPKARSLLGGDDQLGIAAVLQRLDERRATYASGDAAAWTDARQQAEVAAQARRMAETWEFEAREFARARNAEWALAQLDGGKLMIAASNRQVAAEVPGAAPSMGNFLRQWLGADYRAIGSSFAGGQVRGEECAMVAVTVEDGSLDAALVAAGAKDVWIDLRGRTGAWTRPQRIGGETLRPAAAFDAIAAYGRVEPATPIAGPCPQP